MSEYRRYNLTLTVVDPSARNRFRALSRPESFFEIRPNRQPGQRGAYSVEMTQSEYEAALEDAANPESNLIAVEPDRPMMQAQSVPGSVVVDYAAMGSADSLGLTGSGVDVGVIERGFNGILASLFGSRVKASEGFGSKFFEDGSSRTIRPDDPAPGTQPTHGAHMASLAVPPSARIVAGAYDGSAAKWAATAYWMVDEIGVDIISNSQHESEDAGATVLIGDAVSHIRSNNVLLFSSAGNGGFTNSGPGQDVITSPAKFAGANAISNYRPSTDSIASTSNYGSKIWAAAPGCEVYVNVGDGSIEYIDDGGTSAAAAITSGMAARFMTGGRSPGNVESYLANNARATGASPLYEGNGVLQLAAAEQELQQDKPDKIDLNGDPVTGSDGSTQDGTANPDPGACG